MLKLERVSKYYFTGNNVIQALRRINLEFKIGEFVAITGESGSGKSTLLNVLSGLDTYEEGKVFYNGKDFSNYTLEELEHYRKDYIGYIFQEYNIINSYTVYQNVELALLVQGYKEEEIHDKVMDLIEKVGLKNVADHKAGNLSGGEKQRTVIARTLAKDYQILVCDEPTGNLNEEASEEIFKLLREISKEKLVIAVTHDVSEIQKYATRKIRLYDGEVMEDSQLTETKKKAASTVSPKLSKTSVKGAMKIGLQNIFSVPKKSVFALLALIFILSTVAFVYSAKVMEMNKPYAVTNKNFVNTDPSRIILSKFDKTQFTDEQIDEIKGLSNVQTVIDNDIVFDSIFTTKVYDDLTSKYIFHDYKPASSYSLTKKDLIAGTMPEKENEVVVSDDGVFKVGDFVSLANSHLLFKVQKLATNQYFFKVVGVTDKENITDDGLSTMYFTNDGLNEIAPSSVLEQSEVWLNFNGTKEYDTPTDTWITPDMDSSVDTLDRSYMVPYPIWVSIDNLIADDEIKTFDMMYFDVCRDFGYKKEVHDDVEAGLCTVNDFLDSHEVSFKAITPFNNTSQFGKITLVSSTYSSSDQAMKLYMNQKTYDKYFDESRYQITVVVKDLFDGNKVMDELQKLGYNAYYPAQMIDSDTSTTILLQNVLITVIALILILAIFFIGYFILNNIILSKLKDYLIIRSIGASKSTLKRMLYFEIFALIIIAIIIITVILLIVDKFIYRLPTIIRYYRMSDYIILIGLILIMIEIMILKFTRKIFKASVITTLKGVE